jgi:hypothetical protein
MDLAREAAISLEDLTIENVGEWAGSVEEFADALFDEVFKCSDEAACHTASHTWREGQPRKVKGCYICSMLELSRSGLIRNDANSMFVCIARMAGTALFANRSVVLHRETVERHPRSN